MKYIITADDFGLSKSTNDAIYDGIEKGVITSTNVMVNMPYFEEAVKLRKEFSKVSIGLHWNLTTGFPLSDQSEVPTLVDDNGEFWGFEVFKKKLKQNKISYKDIEKELSKQLKKYTKALGKPDYWNTHNHIQMLPKLFRICVKIAKQNQVMIMRNNYKIYSNKTPFVGLCKNIIIRGMYSYAKVNKMHYIDGMLCFSDPDQKLEIDTYKNKKKQTVEVILHIAKELDSPYFGSLQKQRMDEYNFITSKFVNYKDKFKLASFKD